MDDAIHLSLLVILVTAAINDVRFQKIPNILSLSTIGVGFAYHLWQSGLQGLLFSLGGTLLGMAFLILFYLGGKMGAGDVKLMGAVGSILGPSGVFKAFLFTAVVGGIYAIILLLCRGRLIETLERISLSLKQSFLTTKPTFITDDGKTAPVLYYALAIWIGTSLSMVF